MSIDRRITNGLAWAGVLLVVGIPTADLLASQFFGLSDRAAPVVVASIARIAPVPAPLSQRPVAPVLQPAPQVATVTPARPAAAVVAPLVAPVAVAANAPTGDAVDTFLQSGRQLPSYITGASVGPVAAPTAATTTAAVRPVITMPAAPAAAIDPIEVASVPPQKVAPIPMPLSMRPRSVAAVTMPAQNIVIPSGLTPAAPSDLARPPAEVVASDLEDWESGPLSDFLAARQGSSATVDRTNNGNGFYLDQGPNRPGRDRVIARERDEPFFIFD